MGRPDHGPTPTRRDPLIGCLDGDLGSPEANDWNERVIAFGRPYATVVECARRRVGCGVSMAARRAWVSGVRQDRSVTTYDAGEVSALRPGTVIGTGPWAVGNSRGELFAVSRRCRHLRVRNSHSLEVGREQRLHAGVRKNLVG